MSPMMIKYLVYFMAGYVIKVLAKITKSKKVEDYCDIYCAFMALMMIVKYFTVYQHLG